MPLLNYLLVVHAVVLLVMLVLNDHVGRVPPEEKNENLLGNPPRRFQFKKLTRDRQSKKLTIFPIIIL